MNPILERSGADSCAFLWHQRVLGYSSNSGRQRRLQCIRALGQDLDTKRSPILRGVFLLQ